ncbi:MAG: lamin tail domain-containing protein [Pseudomonadota bacterium]
MSRSASGRPLASLFICLGLTAGLSPAAFAQVFINEIHYDNASTDVGEAIELAGPAGTDLTGWNIVLYNGANGSVYDTTALGGTLPNQQGGLGTIVVTYPSNGLQNGGPDGIALVDAGGIVVQFLSYEGEFTAVGGPADGLLSSDIGVAESSGTAVGDSLQLTGSGSFPGDFTWAPEQPNTFGNVNTGQTFGGGEPPEPELVINEIDYDQPGGDSAEFIELRNSGAVAVELGNYSLEFVNGSGGGAAVYATIPLPATSLAAGDYFVVCANAATTANCNLDVSPDTNLIQNGAPDAVALLLGAEIVDAVSYEGDVPAPYVEGSGAGLEDPFDGAFQSISRFPNGADTDQNNVDFSLRCTTPGAANVADSTDCRDPLAGPPVVINEFLADPATGLGGDANNDGTRDSSDDEFIEIVNISGGPLDVSGWTVADGATLRHTFPANTILDDQCGIVVFGGGSPTGGFGGVLVQTASSGALGLNNGGDSITINDGAGDIVVIGYGSEGGSDESLTLDPDVTGALPYVQHEAANGAAGASYSPGTRVDGTVFAGCELPILGPFEVFEIQGDGGTSPFVGQRVITQGNVVTALAGNGFFIQTPASRSDNNVDTSDGTFVFTDALPTVVVGDLVDVTGSVVEFFGFTQLADPEVTVTGGGLALPEPVVFDASVPSPDPAAPSCAIEFECYEGMRITVAKGSVGQSNQRFNSDPIAEVRVTASAERSFREPGIETPGLPDLPVWDGNPEVFELDPDRLGLPNRIIAAGSTYSATGVLGFEFGGYEIWPTELAVDENPLPLPARKRSRFFETTVASLNLFRLFDDIDDAPLQNALGETINDAVVPIEEYQRRLDKAARYILEGMRAPDILGVQEVESAKVLEDLAAAIRAINPYVRYDVHLVEGNDIGSIDVGFLTRRWRVFVTGVEQLGADETFIDPSDGSIDLVHDRPPLVLNGWTPLYPLSVMVVHNRSLSGIETERVQTKRLTQALSVAEKVQTIQTTRPWAGLVVIGDFNAFEFSDGYVDAVGHIRGDFDPAESLLSGADLVEPNLMNQIQSLPPEERYSFVFRGNAQVLDHALTSQPLDFRVRGLQFVRGNADAAVDLINDDSTYLRASDHDGFVLYIDTNPFRRHR